MHVPQAWTPQELEEAAATSLAHFVQERLQEGSAPYREVFPEARRQVEALFKATRDLQYLEPHVLQNNPELVEAARYLGAPPLSQDDLNTLAGGTVVGRKRIPDDVAAKAVTAIRAFLDPFRCPWVDSGSRPTRHMRRAAIDWTASLWAIEMCRTARRGEASTEQEEAVDRILRSFGLEQQASIRRISALDELPRRHFTREVLLAQAKADLAVRLNQGRLLAIECKVSNSALSSVKRLNRETAGKAEHWRTVYGQQVVTVAVLAGVFKVSSLMDAQASGVYIVWAHDLEPLRRFVAASCAT
jgi:hypothetical protein